MGTGKLKGGGITLQWTSIPSRGSRNKGWPLNLWPLNRDLTVFFFLSVSVVN